MRPVRKRPSKTQESDWRGNEQIIFRTLPLARRAASPESPLPALFDTTTRSRAPWRMSASIRSTGMPAIPKPLIRTVEPSSTPATAWSVSSTTTAFVGVLIAVP